jgi:hypothetical protein
MTPALYTARYADFDPRWGVPVRITVGRPRRFPHELEQLLELAPYGRLFKIEDRDEFEPAYRARLDLKFPQPAQLRARLAEISARHGGRPLVLLCYERIGADNDRETWCHRRCAARYIRSRLGVPLPPELPRDAATCGLAA